ncbi:MAG: acyl-CoA dehydratase activase [Bacteroides sp.]
MEHQVVRVGLDVGSTTLKVVSVDVHGCVLQSFYTRHNADVAGTLERVFKELARTHAGDRIQLAITGSAGMGIAERCGLQFVQEVIAACRVAETHYPEAVSLVDIGGEDAKMIFFEPNRPPDIRMNGSCAGGTGAFIDQMAVLLGIDVENLGALAEKATRKHPIASRCGVFSKTDIQNLLARGAKKEDIAASIFHAVSVQVLTTLSRGYTLRPSVILCGGPFAHIEPLRKAFIEATGLSTEDFILPECAEAIPAWGTALSVNCENPTYTFAEFLQIFAEQNRTITSAKTRGLTPLFRDEDEYNRWLDSKSRYKLPTADLASAREGNCFLGIDSGSTTTKVIVLNSQRQIIFRSYRKNSGDPLGAVSISLLELAQEAANQGVNIQIGGSCVTGYGEDLIRKAFGLNLGVVETIAHFVGASFFDPEVSFILDIGGQDMKAVFIDRGTIARLEINEACSSGCGSFIETFATSLGQEVATFATEACNSSAPCDLGTRCTVFMNSRVKQALREGATHADISAGLGYAVVRNCLNKVLKIKDFKVLGDHIMVQGGTLRNPSVSRAFELETGRKVIITDAPELMGAFGAALHAEQEAKQKNFLVRDLVEIANVAEHSTKIGGCKGCYNRCEVTTFTFENGEIFFAGNKCEKIFSNQGEAKKEGKNISEWKYKRIFNYPSSHISPNPTSDIPVIGIPRILGMYEHYPFWFTLFDKCGFAVKLSSESTLKLSEKGVHTVMSDNICFPAKIAHGHVMDLIRRGVDRIFIPFVVYEAKEVTGVSNSFNCPVVSGYSEVLRSALGGFLPENLEIDAPSISFKDVTLLKKQCWDYIKRILPKKFDLSYSQFDKAYNEALTEQERYFTDLILRNQAIAEEAEKEERTVVMLAGRPYHTDPLIQHKISQIITEFGVDVLTEDIARRDTLDPHASVSVHQWGFTNRIIAAAHWAAKAGRNFHYIQITSFGCGPDAYVIDEATEILRAANKTATILKVDDVSNVGSLRLRIRSLIESLKLREGANTNQYRIKESVHCVFEEKDRYRTILLPWFGDSYSPYLPTLFELAGYKAENLPPSAESTAVFGLRYSNNEICYPATLVVGDFMQAIATGKYKREDIAFGITQTGGQCRATNYVGLVKKALQQVGLDDIPVISVAVGNGEYNEQPGFKIPWKKLAYPLMRILVYADIISSLFQASRVRERIVGVAQRLFDKYTKLGVTALKKGETKRLYEFLKNAAEDFNNAITFKVMPRIGVVGEIFVKYNRFANRGIVDWLASQGIEPVVPALCEFFLEALASARVRVKDKIERASVGVALLPAIERYIFRIIRKMESCVKHFPYYRPIGIPSHEAALASSVINLNAQFGEGWLIPASFVRFAQEGILSVVCLQPFGCIANHIVAKGIEKKVRELYPNLSLLFLDLDSGVSEVNFFNRLYFLKENAMAQVNNPLPMIGLSK